MVQRTVLPIFVALSVGTISFWRGLALVALETVAIRRSERNGGAGVMRIEVEEVVGLGAYKVV